MKPRTVVLVGHCGPDAHLLRNAVSRAVANTPITIANDSRELDQHLEDAREILLLINRVLDGGFSHDSGVGLIKSLADRKNPPEMILVSNYAEAQAQAVQAGARQGFGKTQLYN